MSRIITFYSYKGGVGRTLALVNVGVLLAKRGKRVLLMDWDLEAPGLDRYFSSYLQVGSSVGRGTIFLLAEAIAGNTDWRSHIQEIIIGQKNAETKVQCSLSLMTSGVDSPDYAQKVRGFSWKDFMDKDGGSTLEKWREEWLREFDYILLDSRTGITDAGGLCTILLPDFLVLVYTANDQSFEGALSIMRSAQIERLNLSVPRPPLIVLPLLSKFDRKAETELADRWLLRFATGWKTAYDDWLPSKYKPYQIIELTKIPYVTLFSFGEPLPVLTHSLTDPELPGFYLENIARLLATDFKDSAKIINPNEVEPKATKEKLLSLIEQAFDEVEMNRLLRQLETEIGAGIEYGGVLNDAATLLQRQARYSTAEPLMRRALEIVELSLGPENSNVAAALNNLALLLKDTNRFNEAEPLMRRALSIEEKSLGPKHANVAIALNNLAVFLKNTNRITEAEPMMRRSLEISEELYGADNPAVATSLNSLALLLQQSNRLKEAEPLIRRSLEISEKSYGAEDFRVATALNNLAQILLDTNRLSEAERLMYRTLAIFEKIYGPEHPQVAVSLNNISQIMMLTDRRQEAEPLMQRALLIFEKVLGQDHPQVAICLGALAEVFHRSGRVEEAESLMRRSVQIFEKSYGLGHPDLATSLNNLAQLLRKTGRSEEAEKLMRRSLEINERSFGLMHTNVAVDLNNLAFLLIDAGKFSEAEEMSRRHLVIFLKFSVANGHNHPHLASAFNNYSNLLTDLQLTPAEINAKMANIREEVGISPELFLKIVGGIIKH